MTAIFNLRDMILKGMNMWRAKHGIAPLAPGQGRQEVGHGELSDWETSDEEGEGDNGGKMRVRPLKVSVVVLSMATDKVGT